MNTTKSGTAQVETQDVVSLTYTNWRGQTAQCTIIPRRVWFGSTDWHPEPQWLLTAFDVEKQADRIFALKDFGRAVGVRDEALVNAARKVHDSYWYSTDGVILGMYDLGRALSAPDCAEIARQAPTWRPIADAPQRPGFTCDIWSASEQRRFTDCFWDKDHWSYEDFDCGHYRVRKVPDPVAFIPCPEAPAS